MKRILIIEDDTSIAEIERDFLEIDGFQVVIENDGKKGCTLAKEGGFDLILLDLMLPGMSGLDICRDIRDKVDIPILMVTARIEDTDKIRGLGLGADDYISKPFNPPELVARVKSNIAQYERLKGTSFPRNDEELEIGTVKVHIPTRRVYANGQEVSLKNKEFELLVFLMENKDIVFSKERIYERIWGMDAFGDLKTVAVHINRIREKVEVNPQDPQYLQTVWGAGYRFNSK